jgi:mannosyltransferase OCH1-like enzyme
MRYIINHFICVIILFLGALVYADGSSGIRSLAIDFDVSMRKHDDKFLRFVLSDLYKKNNQHYESFKRHYNDKMPSKMTFHDKMLIPKIMHHVWLGGTTIPALYQNYMEECKKLHPDWDFKVWTEDNVHEIVMQYPDLYYKSRSYAARSDVIRHEVVYKFGGVYRDMDVKCYRPLDDLNHMYDLYTALEPDHGIEGVIINTGVLGASPQHPIISKSLKMINDRYDAYLKDFAVNKIKYTSYHHLGITTHLLPFTEAFLALATPDDRNIALPISYFMPAYHYIPDDKFLLERFIKNLLFGSYEPKLKFAGPESFTNHNLAKVEVLFPRFDIGNGVYSIRNPVHALPDEEQKIYSVFKTAYSIAKEYTYRQSNAFPQTIHFIIQSQDEHDILKQNIEMWTMLNNAFDIIVWDKNKLEQDFISENGDLDAENSKFAHDSEAWRMYHAIRILSKMGGVYVDFRAKPYVPVFDLTNKFDYVASMLPINHSTKQIILSSKLLVAKPKHPILVKTLSEINNTNSVDSIMRKLTINTFETIAINGKNIVIPALHCHPIDKVGLKDTIFLDKIPLAFQNLPQPLSGITEYTIME